MGSKQHQYPFILTKSRIKIVKLILALSDKSNCHGTIFSASAISGGDKPSVGFWHMVFKEGNNKLFEPGIV